MIKKLGFLAILTVLVCSTAWAAMPKELVLYYSFDKDTIDGETVKDLTDYGNDGRMIGGPEIVTGQVGDAIAFSGSNCVEIVTSESLASTKSQITMEAWVKNMVDGTAEIISKWDNTNDGIIHFEAKSGNNMRFCMRKDDNSKIVDFTTSTGGLTLDTWVHVAEVYDGSKAIIYFDGEEVGSASGSGEMRENENCKWWIGSMYSTGRFLNGQIDELRIWNEPLTQDEIKKSMEGTLVTMAVDGDGKLAVTWAQMK